MILRARQNGKTMVFELEGHLDFETTQQFQQTCADLLERQSTEQVVFNLQKLKFVGSSGINQFIQAIKAFNGRPAKPKLCNLSPEFVKVFRAYQTTRHPFEIWDDETQAIAAFDAPPPVKKTARKKRT